MYSQGQNFNNQFSMQPQDMSGMQGAAMPSAAMPAQPNKKLNLPWILVIAEAAIILILGIVLIMSGGNKPNSIANDKTENVALSANGNIEAFSAVCETPDYYIAFFKDNMYSIERKTVSTASEEDEEEEYYDESVDRYVQPAVIQDLVYETGTYTIDGYDLHLKPSTEESYYASYRSHKLTYKEIEYDCKNGD